MKSSVSLRLSLAAALVVGAAVETANADDPPPKQADEKRNKRLNALVEESVGWYHLFSGAPKAEELRPLSVLRWRNASRGQEGEAMMVLWLHEGRPEAMASIYPWMSELQHEFVSLSRGEALVAKENGAVVWSPATFGVAFRDVPGAPSPAETRPARLQQMKALADRFKATMTGWRANDSDREELRLLPRPLHRYPSSSASPLADGAVFAFVQGTDPEALLVLEDPQDGGRARWQFALVRATSGGLEARLNGAIIWTAEKQPGSSDPARPYATLRHPLPQ
jgi:hypothetical protein